MHSTLNFYRILSLSLMSWAWSVQNASEMTSYSSSKYYGVSGIWGVVHLFGMYQGCYVLSRLCTTAPKTSEKGKNYVYKITMRVTA